MRQIFILISLATMGCTAIGQGMESSASIVGQYELVRIDNKRVGKLGMRMSLDNQGRVALAYDCGEQFARYQFNQSRITFDLQSPTGSVCDIKLGERRHLFYTARTGMINHDYAVSQSRNKMYFSGWHTFEFEVASR